jgi:hypothetical protein
MGTTVQRRSWRLREESKREDGSRITTRDTPTASTEAS